MNDISSSGISIEDEPHWDYDEIEDLLLDDNEELPEGFNTLEEFDEWLAQ